MDYLPKAPRKPNPIERAGYISKLFFLYSLQLFKKETKANLHDVTATLKSQNLGNEFEKLWEQQHRRKNVSIVRLLLKRFGIYYFFLGLTQLMIKTTFLAVNNVLISKFVSFFVPGQTSVTEIGAYFYAVFFILGLIADSVYTEWYEFQLLSLEIRVRVAFCSLIYRKSLKLSSAHVHDMSIGKIVTLITKDVYNFETFIGQANIIWIRFLQVVALMYLIYRKIGALVFIPMAFFIVLVPLQVFIGMKSTSMKFKMFQETEKRLQAAKETLLSMKIVKMYAWESFFNKKLNKMRRQEIQLTCKIFFLEFITASLSDLWICASFLPWLVIIKVLGVKLTSDMAYFMLSNYKLITHFLVNHISTAVCQTAHAFATIKRINQFLNMEEISRRLENVGTARVFLKNVTVESCNLKNVNFEITEGLVSISGPVGGGKTSLLKLILGEFSTSILGKLEVDGTISYASQDPWLFPSTIRQNILFGEEYNAERYCKVLEVCDLIYDFNRFQNGDQTVIESHGYNLSKGQRNRINLARAIYRDRDIYLLDDSLAALDVTVGTYVFKECIQKFLSNKLVFLVTNNSKFVNKTDRNFIVTDGMVTEVTQSEKVTITEWIAPQCNIDEHEVSRKIYEETRQKGSVSYKVYQKWMQAGGGVTLCIFVTCCVGLPRVMTRYLEKLISLWLFNQDLIVSGNVTSFAEIKQKQENLVVWFIILSLILLLVIVASLLLLAQFSKNVSLTFHRILIEKLLNARMDFYENNFVGNVLNRLSKDLIIIDEIIPIVLHNFYFTIFMVISVLILLVSVRIVFIFPTSILLIILCVMCRSCLYTARNLKRLEAATKSPLVGYFSATLSGITTIKAEVDVKSQLQEEYDNHQDLYTSASFASLCTKRGFILAARLLSSLISAFVVFYLLVVKPDAASVGLATTMAPFIVEMLSMSFSRWCDLENHMTSVERVLEYTKIKQEKHSSLSDPKWSRLGEIIFENVYVTHPNLKEPVLKNLNFAVESGEKIGIVGRTGAGKSSLISALFRLYDVDGRICVNGINIKTISVQFLRSNISVVPQDPIIFDGTIRENVDPFGVYTDGDIWNAVESVHLGSLIQCLDEEISGFSTGQKQLLCLARALVRNNQIVVIDEATANVDVETEALMVDVIKEKFCGCTVLMVSHSIETLRNCDKIMVLDKGEIVEFGCHSELLQNDL